MKGSFTVELALIFPIILMLLVVFMQFGLYFMYRIYTLNTVDQSLAICNRARQEKKTTEEARQLAEEYARGTLENLPIEITKLQCEVSSEWFQEEYTMVVEAGYSFVLELNWTAVGKSCVMNPVEFRNRIDFVWEKGQQYLEWFKKE